MDKLLELIKKLPPVVGLLFPRPILPQKRYILMFVGIAYMLAKIYVTVTPSPEDDKILEQVHATAMELLASNAEVAETRAFGESN